VFDNDRVPDSFSKELYDGYYNKFRDKGMNRIFGKDSKLTK
jgi:hypothetical protein